MMLDYGTRTPTHRLRLRLPRRGFRASGWLTDAAYCYTYATYETTAACARATDRLAGTSSSIRTLRTSFRCARARLASASSGIRTLRTGFRRARARLAGWLVENRRYCKRTTYNKIMSNFMFTSSRHAIIACDNTAKIISKHVQPQRET